jgi:hypothetical protein
VTTNPEHHHASVKLSSVSFVEIVITAANVHLSAVMARLWREWRDET